MTKGFEEELIANEVVGGRNEKELDAGALFVLKSEGSWIHCGYHLATAVVTPSLLSLPFAFASLGWAAGIVSLTIMALVSFYSYNLISLVLEHNAHKGNRQLRFTDMANDILGSRWCRYYVGPIQFLACYGAVVGSTLLGGQCMKAIYILTNPHGNMHLCYFITIFGGLMLILAQMPSFHSLRHISLVSLILSISFSVFATAGSIHIGMSPKAPEKSYSITNEKDARVFDIFTALSIIATAFGNGIIPEIQATIAPPVKGKMFKGLCACYAVIAATFLSVSISGYWAFGNKADVLIQRNFLDEGRPLIAKWFILAINIFIFLQLSAVAVVYLQPTNEVLERHFADPTRGEFSIRNVIPRVVFRSLTVAATTTVGAMLPFFGDVSAVLGAFSFMPLDFVLPLVFYNLTFKPSKKSAIYWLNALIVSVFSVLALIGAVSAIRQVCLDAKTYRLFANI